MWLRITMFLGIEPQRHGSPLVALIAEVEVA
jgi:hypothetical protein